MNSLDRFCSTHGHKIVSLLQKRGSAPGQDGKSYIPFEIYALLCEQCGLTLEQIQERRKNQARPGNHGNVEHLKAHNEKRRNESSKSQSVRGAADRVPELQQHRQSGSQAV